MDVILSAVVPVVLLLVIGNLLRRFELVSFDFWRVSDKLIYFLFFPALLITKVSKVDLSGVDVGQLYLSVVVFFVILTVISFIIYKFFAGQGNQFSSIYQGLTRFNSYIFIALAAAVWGETHFSFVALLIGIVVPTVNVLCVLSFSVGGGQVSLRKVVQSVISNPLIIGCVLGFIANIYPSLLPIAVFNTMDILSKAALPLALLSIGAAVRVNLIFDLSNAVNPLMLWMTTLVRLFIAPIIYWGIAYVFGFPDITTHILILLAAVPTATSAYILSRQMGGDVDLMVAIISLETVLSIFSLMFWLYILVG